MVDAVALDLLLWVFWIFLGGSQGLEAVIGVVTPEFRAVCTVGLVNGCLAGV